MNPAPQETIQAVALSELLESPFNPRRTFNAESLRELAVSIKQQGVMQPIVVRDRWKSQPHAYPRFEIVFGHRRFRACQLAALEGAPIVIRDMTDEQVKVAQLHENAEREDVNAIEEAEAFERLMKEHGLTAEDLMQRTSKSRSHIYGRLKLLQLCPEVREACAIEGLPVDVAVAIGRLKGEATQRRALERVRHKIHTEGSWRDMGWVSVRAAKHELAALRLVIPLIQAPFDLEDATLRADGRVCSSCPTLSDNDPDTLEAYGAGVCTDSECFNERKAAHFTAAMSAHQAAGGRALTGPDAAAAIGRASWPLDYSYGDREFVTLGTTLAKGVTVGQALDQAREKLGAATPSLALASTEPNIQPASLLALADLKTLCATLGLPLPVAAGGNPPQHPAAQAQKGGADGDDDEQGELALPLTEEEEATQGQWGAILRAIMRKAIKGKRTVDELRMVVSALLTHLDEVPEALAEVMGWEEDLAAAGSRYGDDVDWVHRRLPTMTADELGALLVAIALCEAPYEGATHMNAAQRAAANVALAKAYGVNPLDPDAEPSTADLPQLPAAQAPNGGAAQASKPLTKYRDDATGMTWSGRGLIPKWLRVAIESGKHLTDFEVGRTTELQMDGTADAGGEAGVLAKPAQVVKPKKARRSTPAAAGGNTEGKA